jgi:hypothetical protein
VLAHICRSVGTISIRLDEASGAISVKLGAFSYLTAWRMHVAAALLLDGTRDQPGGLPIRSVGCFTPNLTVLMCRNMTSLQTAHKINTDKSACRTAIIGLPPMLGWMT